MRFLKFTSLAMSFALVAATAAHADTITLSLSTPTTSFAGGTETLTYGGTITASSLNAGNVYLNGDSLNVQSPLTADDTDFYLNVPQYLSAGDVFTGYLFTATVPYGTPLGSYLGSFVLLGGSAGDSSDTLVTANFQVSATPEPSSFLLLGTGLLGVAGNLRKNASRRKTNPGAHQTRIAEVEGNES